MRAAILAALRRPLVVDDVEVPEPGRGQALVRVRYSGVCGSQLGEIDGIKGPDRHLPHLLGHEGAGVVEAVGRGVTRLKAGDHVVLHWRKGAGLESEPPRYRWRGRPLNAGWVTTFNERAVVSENRATPIPKSFDLATASLFGCAVTTAMGIVHNDAGVRPGESVLVFGAGGVGLAVIQAAALAGAVKIVAVDLFDHKLAAARRFGATHTVNARTEDARARVSRHLGRADVAVDNTGNVKAIELAYELTADRGRTVLVGVSPRGSKIAIDPMPLHFGKRITGSHGGGADPSADIPRLARLARSGRLKLDGMITHRFPLERINDALACLRSGQAAGRVLVEL